MKALPRFIFFAFLLQISTFITRSAEPEIAAKPEDSILQKLVFDSMTKRYNAKVGELNALFTFNITNTSPIEITVDRVQTSCGCTVASLPGNPWHIAPGDHGVVGATMDLNGKAPGLITKTLTLFISTNGGYAGTRVATVQTDLPAPPAPTVLTEDERKAAMAQAKSDPQKIFKDPKCAECHVKQGINQWTERLYAADCGICHDSPNRESSVPDLHALKVPTSFAYWKDIINHGKPNTMMPAFSTAEGGPLNDEQVHSIAEYLARNFNSHPASAAAQGGQ